MKIQWISDYGLNFPGGAQKTDQKVVEYLRSKNHDVIEGTNEIADVDVAIISNAKQAMNHDLSLLKQFKDTKIVKFEHDHACRWRAFFPFQEVCKTQMCPEKVREKNWIYKEVDGIVYLSPAHKSAHDVHWDKTIQQNSLVAPPFVDYDLFKKDEDIEKIPNSVYMVANLLKFKSATGNLNFIRNNSNYNYYHYGSLNPLPIMMEEAITDDVKFITSYIDNKQMPKEMNRYERFLHISNYFLPFERAVLEAFFVGNELIINKNIGATSFEWFGNYDKSVEAMDNTRPQFLEFLEGL